MHAPVHFMILPSLASLKALQQRLHPPRLPLHNPYLHVTTACPLHCSHCYGDTQDGRNSPSEIPVAAIEELVREARSAGFAQVVITGGEPLVHSQRAKLWGALAKARDRRPGTPRLVLRSSFALPLHSLALAPIAHAVDRVVVSVDGNQATHDARRGAGCYERVVRNVAAYATVARRTPGAAELVLNAVLSHEDRAGNAGSDVRLLGRQLGVGRVRFSPLLPLGRAADCRIPDPSWKLDEDPNPEEVLAAGAEPHASCGLGSNLQVDATGEAFPCHACRSVDARLGNVIEQGLLATLRAPAFEGLGRSGVDTTEPCQRCAVRYLCGGLCRAWGQPGSSGELAEQACANKRWWAEQLLGAARALVMARPVRPRACSARPGRPAPRTWPP